LLLTLKMFTGIDTKGYRLRYTDVDVYTTVAGTMPLSITADI